MAPRVPNLKYSEDVLTRTWQAASVLLDYPDQTLFARMDLLTEVAASLPVKLGAGLHATIEHLRRQPLRVSESDYVDTFDTRRRGCLFLTYFSNGETRKRGLALLRIKQVYTRAGLVLTDDQLPDHLCVVLEFAATTDQRAGVKMLLDNRAGLELLRLHLTEIGSPWGGAVEAVCATLPPLKGKDHEAVQRLIADGPADEQVGLSPYGMPELAPTSGGV
ncbi:nitrate reductase molybdenum cofactor assembly chaperone [Humibacillus sp. DSM 29435]|uniref:nitrate reductase molybdenum cofactor assembly chaperone n=1 Tax=Humibacillus sp. DSM 29435 TaxID=1869167 RepID=UPI000871E302|nr:nitrate reductase molybdenum cofactor assembly chaperone [Humibacillus sp. DSM 29435]OFE18712.1 nitrate reductase molybdenum cofactor assembly chaperone [Humibacillus sp. DSM 29435]